MPPEQAELSAEDVLLDAVLGPDPNEVDVTHDRDSDLDQPDDLDEVRAEDGEQEEAPEGKAKEPEAEPEEDYVEIAAAEGGGEPTRIKVADLVASHQAYEKLRGQEAQIIDRVEREATERATAQLRHVETFAKQTATQIQAAMQVLQPPQPPSAEQMLDPRSPNYDPDRYHMEFARYQRAAGSFQQAQSVARDLLAQAERATNEAAAARETAELNKLQRAWPEFRDRATIDKFVSDAGKEYGYTPDELDASLTDHRNALVLRDALAYRQTKAKGAEVKKAVEAKAPKLVRTKQEAKGSSASSRDDKGRFVGDAKAQAMKRGTDDAWAGYFATLSKAGRF